jgi:prevent-host-death family protein
LGFRVGGNAFILAGLPVSAVLYILKYMKYFSMAEARANLAKILDSALSDHERTVITRNGDPAAVLLSIDDYESMNETLEILADPELTKYLIEYQQNPDAEPGYTAEEVRAILEARSAESDREAV